MKNAINKLYGVESRVSKLENLVEVLELRLEELAQRERSHILRLNSGDQLSTDFITGSAKYIDLSPEQAHKIHCDKNRNFILLDVSHSNYRAPADLPDTTKIPLEELESCHYKIGSRTLPILVISEEGLSSIKACERLYDLGYLNISNISGGYKYWPGFKNLRPFKVA